MQQMACMTKQILSFPIQNALDLPVASKVFCQQLQKNFKRIHTSDFTPHFTRIFRDLACLNVIVLSIVLTHILVYLPYVHPTISNFSTYQKISQILFGIKEKTNKWKVTEITLNIDKKLAKIFVIAFRGFSLLTLFHRIVAIDQKEAIVRGMGILGVVASTIYWDDKFPLSLSDFVNDSLKDRVISLGFGFSPEILIAASITYSLKHPEEGDPVTQLWELLFG